MRIEEIEQNLAKLSIEPKHCSLKIEGSEKVENFQSNYDNFGKRYPDGFSRGFFYRIAEFSKGTGYCIRASIAGVTNSTRVYSGGQLFQIQSKKYFQVTESEAVQALRAANLEERCMNVICEDPVKYTIDY